MAAPFFDGVWIIGDGQAECKQQARAVAMSLTYREHVGAAAVAGEGQLYPLIYRTERT
jgi:hypothetical protein